MTDTPHDAYSEWLGIPGANRPPNYYELLGISQGESRRSVIEQAAAAQLAKLQAPLRGPQSRLARRIKFEIDSALVCLTDPKRKVAYDQQSGSSATSRTDDYALADEPASPSPPTPAVRPTAAPRIATTRTPVASRREQPSAAPHAPQQPEPLPLSDLPSADPAERMLRSVEAKVKKAEAHARRKEQERKVRQRLQVGALLTGLAILLLAGGIFAIYSSGKPHNTTAALPPVVVPTNPVAPPPPPPPPPPFSSTPADNTSSPADNPSAPADNPTTPANDPPLAEPAQPVTMPPPIEAIPGTAVPPVAPASSTPEPAMPQSVEPTKPPIITAELAWELPSLEPRNVDHSTEIGRLPDGFDDQCEVALRNPDWQAEAAITFTARAIKTSGVSLWQIDLSRSSAPSHDAAKTPLAAIGELRLDRGRAFFQWRAEAQGTKADRLRHCVVELHNTASNRRIALRHSKALPAYQFDPDQSILRIGLGDGCPPLKQLRLEVLSRDDFPATTKLQGEHPARGSNEVYVVARTERPAVGIELQLETYQGEPHVVIRPLVVDGEPIPFTRERLDTMARTLPIQLRQAQDRLAGLRRAHVDLENAKSHTLSNSEGTRRNLAIKAINEELRNNEVQQKALGNMITVYQARLKLLPDLGSLLKEMTHKAQIGFRVYFECDGGVVELLRAEGKPPPA